MQPDQDSQDQATHELTAAIAALEAQRAILGDAVVEASIAALREKLAALEEDTPALRGERKLVTVLFADIAGFTTLAETLDPETVRDLMNACFERLVPIIEHYGGTVDKFIGDGIMALFGAPVAHENDPERALRAALAMQDALAAFNAERSADGSTELAEVLGLHFGINTGLVIAGGIGTRGQQQYSVMGDAVNLAARLEEVSARGEILVGPDTYRLAAPLFDFEPLDPIRPKGRVEAVQIYKLLGTKTRPGSLRGLAGLVSPMVGRDAELATLCQVASDVRAGRSHVVLVGGEPGLGKSRLIAEWRSAMAGSVQWAEGRCLSYGQDLAYHLLIDLLRSIVGVPVAADEPETRAALLALVQDLFGDAALDVYPYLGQLLSLRLEGEVAERVRLLDPQALQAQYLTALRRLFLALAARNPWVFVFEDIHWADPASVDLTTKLLPLVSDAPLLFCFVTRPEPDVPGWKLITAVRQQMSDTLTEVILRSLSEDDSQQLISNLLEIEALPAQVRALISKKAEGNPFFVEEIVRMLIDREAIAREGDRWVARQEVETVEIPDNLHGLLHARIDRLPDDVKHTLRVASVIGRQFGVSVLGQVLRRQGVP